MYAKIERFGNSLGLILPKELMDACGFDSEAIVTVRERELIVTPPPRRAREGWAEAIRAIPEEQLDHDFEELKSFRETEDRLDSTDWNWPFPDEKI